MFSSKERTRVNQSGLESVRNYQNQRLQVTHLQLQTSQSGDITSCAPVPSVSRRLKVWGGDWVKIHHSHGTPLQSFTQRCCSTEPDQLARCVKTAWEVLISFNNGAVYSACVSHVSDVLLHSHLIVFTGDDHKSEHSGEQKTVRVGAAANEDESPAELWHVPWKGAW